MNSTPTTIRVKKNPMDLFDSKELVNVCAPMVRYSKLNFRKLVRKYDCDLCFTPMIISDSFVQSDKARQNEFQTSSDDAPLITQFAASNANDLARAAALVYPYSEGCDLNCGCPQRWAMKEGYGACLIHHPEKVSNMIKQTRQLVPDDNFTVSVKIRIHKDTKKTISLCQQLEAAGASFLTVHGRRADQRAEPVDLDTIRNIVDAVDIPVIANGDITCLEKAKEIQDYTGVKGVMAARGLLSNPAMFAGHPYTPLSCVKDWVNISVETGTHFSNFHHHLMYMLEKQLTRTDRKQFNSLASLTAVINYLEEKCHTTM